MDSGRPLPDLCLIAVIKQLTPNDQLKASEISPQCTELVRSTNRRVKTLVITDSSKLEDAEADISSFSLAYKPSMKLLPVNDQEEPFADYPLTIPPLNKWNCVLISKDQLLDQPTIDQIVNVYSAVTDVKFAQFGKVIFFEGIILLLQCFEWAEQLTSLMLAGNAKKMLLEEKTTTRRLIDVINGLTNLQYLAINWCYKHELSELTVLPQLNAVAFKFENPSICSFLNSLERHAAQNDNLQVHLIFGNGFNEWKNVSNTTSRLFIRIETAIPFTIRDNLQMMSNKFSSLTSLSVRSKKPNDVAPLFTALAQLQSLIHLSIDLKMETVSPEEMPLLPRPQATLNSLRALDLFLVIRSHPQLQWLNLQQTLPRLQTINVKSLACSDCDHFTTSSQGLQPEDKSLRCIVETLPQLHFRVQPELIAFGNETAYSTLEQLFNLRE